MMTPLPSTPTRYSLPQILLHWLMALLLVGLFVLGTIMADMKLSPAKLKWINWHKWLGISALALLGLRLIARLLWRAPPLPATMSRRDQCLAKFGHGALYLLMLAIPLSGWLMSSAAGYSVVPFKLFALPDLVEKSKALADALREVHETLNWTLLLVVIGHIGAVLKHQLIDKDGLLKRMSLHR